MQKCALKWGTLLNNGVAKHHLTFSFPQRWRRSQRCWEYPSKHRRDRCKRRALLNYFNHRCFYHISQPDTPSGVLGFVFVLHLMFFQQAAGIHIQMLSKAIHCHIQPCRASVSSVGLPSHSRFSSDTIFATAFNTGSGGCFQSSFSAWSRSHIKRSWSLFRYSR